MRVTKTVKEYIQKEVTARMEKRYADEAAEAKRMSNLQYVIEEAALTAAAKVYEKYVKDAILANNAEGFLEITSVYEGIKLTHSYHGNHLTLSTDTDTTRVLGWRRRMNEEICEKVNDIVVTLELGGTKAELMQMLAEI